MNSIQRMVIIFMVLFIAIPCQSYQFYCQLKLSYYSSFCRTSSRLNPFKTKLFSNSNESPSKISPLSSFKEVTGIKLKVQKNLSPILFFYALMYAPIYGIGIGPFGSMTDFSTLKNRGPASIIANEYIVAPKGFTPARKNEVSPVYPVSLEQLQLTVDKVVMQQPRITVVNEDKINHKKEYIQRSFIFRWPDVITFQFIPLDDSHSTLAVHSYSVYGAGDYGVNGNRIRTWLSEVDQAISPNQP